jgi:hypothetical protein
MNVPRFRLLLLLIAIPSLIAACNSVASPLDEAIGETGLEGPFEAIPESDEKLDGATARGPRVAAGTETEVWAVTRAWRDVEETAGVSWEAGEGLDWEAKYDRWVSSFTTQARHHGWGQTFVMPTPYGERAFHAPNLECAEVAMFLRATFASWYHLPFYFSGWDAQGRQALYAGHFGFINASGARIANFPRFKRSYRDYEASWVPGAAWPSDSVLRSRRLGSDDEISFLSTEGEKVGAGAYFDEVFLNKRVGHFMRLLLLYFGSANLADGANMFHIEPEAVAPGDILVERWQRRGIGHVMPIFRVERESEDAIQVSIASGSMPRREPVWEDPNIARSSFVLNMAGGVGETSNGEPYASLGGGLRRFRTAILVSGRWTNDVRPEDRDAYIADTDLDAIAARPARFDEILRSLSPEEKRTAAISRVEAAREHIRMYPASCAARTRREDAFAELYEVTAALGFTRAQVDAEYRTLEDYVFAELTYEASRTCCWNRSTADMHAIIMSYADTEAENASATGMCAMPTVFRAETDGYARWEDHAASLGRADAWRPWSEDESCPQRDVAEDVVSTMRDITDWCAIADVEAPPVEAACDPEGGDDTMTSARLLEGAMNSELCDGDPADWYRVDGDATVVVSFVNADGDLDVEAYDAEGRVIDSSTSIADTERVTGRGTFYVRVYGYAGATNRYRIAIDG